MIKRRLQSQLEHLLATYPVVALLGPRQAGKTTLALELARHCSAAYLVYPGGERFALNETAQAIGLVELMALIAAQV